MGAIYLKHRRKPQLKESTVVLSTRPLHLTNNNAATLTRKNVILCSCMSVHLGLRKSAGLRLLKSAVQVLTSIVLKRIRKIVLFLTSRSVTMSPKSRVLHLMSRSALLPTLNNARLHTNSNATRYTRKNAPLLTNMSVQPLTKRNAKQHTKKNVHMAVVRRPQRNIAIRFLGNPATRFLGKLVSRSPSSPANR